MTVIVVVLVLALVVLVLAELVLDYLISVMLVVLGDPPVGLIAVVIVVVLVLVGVIVIVVVLVLAFVVVVAFVLVKDADLLLIPTVARRRGPPDGRACSASSSRCAGGPRCRTWGAYSGCRSARGVRAGGRALVRGRGLTRGGRRGGIARSRRTCCSTRRVGPSRRGGRTLKLRTNTCALRYGRTRGCVRGGGICGRTRGARRSVCGIACGGRADDGGCGCARSGIACRGRPRSARSRTRGVFAVAV